MEQPISSSVDSKLQISLSNVCWSDPLIGLFRAFESRSIVWVAMLAVVINGIFVIGLGFVVSALYSNAGYQFVPITEVRELPLVLILFLTFAPAVWSFYVWQPRGIMVVFRSLSSNGVIDDSERQSVLADTVKERVIAPCNRMSNFWIALFLTVLAAVVWFLAFSPNDPFLYGQTAKWWSINPLFLWLVWIPFVYVNVYMITWMIIRQAIIINALSHLFRSVAITPKVLHPDRCNGFASVGDYAMRSASITVLFGFWVAFFIISPVVLGLPLNLKADTLTLLLVYVAAVPTLLLPPVWATHLAMDRAKTHALEAIAVQMREMLLVSATDDIERSVALTDGLMKKYRFVDEEYRTWPFRVPAIRRFSIAAVMPLLSTATSILLKNFLA